jgi:hypothetical protein
MNDIIFVNEIYSIKYLRKNVDCLFTAKRFVWQLALIVIQVSNLTVFED